MIASSLATPQIWKKEKPEIIIIILICDGEYVQEGWNGRKFPHDFQVLYNPHRYYYNERKDPGLFSYISSEKDRRHIYLGQFRSKKTTDIYSSGNFVRNNPYQGGEFFSCLLRTQSDKPSLTKEPSFQVEVSTLYFPNNRLTRKSPFQGLLQKSLRKELSTFVWTFVLDATLPNF